MNNLLVILLGPTGVGKTDLSIEIAKYFKTEIISADSRQIFKELTIGTAVPSIDNLNEIKHHFIQSHSVKDYYSIDRFEKEVLNTLDSIFVKTNIAIMTGGSMLYIDAVCNGIDELPDPDPDLRDELNKQFEKDGIEGLRIQLKKLDPDYYETVDLRNPKRLLRAIEVCLTTGKPYSSLRTSTKKERPFKIIKIGLNLPRDILYNRINQRVDKMIEEGLVEEALQVFPFRHLNSLNTVGYKELFDYFEGNTDIATAIDLIKRNTRRYARRQLTWFRKDKDITWFQPDQNEEIIQYLMSSCSRAR